MKRKKWREEEEATLIREYAALLLPQAAVAPGGARLLLARLRTREKKFQPIADRVNAAHHLRDPVAFPFRWSWRDVSVKIHNMRHQFLHVKRKLLPLPAHLHPDHALHLWPNFLLYKQVFGDHLDPHHRSSSKTPASDDDDSLNEEEDEDDDVEEADGLQLAADFSTSDQEVAEKEETIDAAIVDQVVVEEEEPGLGLRRHHPRRHRGKKMGFLGAEMVELGEIAMRREERRRRREASREEEDHERERRKRALELLREMDEEEERREQWRRRRREERREEEEMEWRERMLVMQMEHEKQAMQMLADAFQTQMQVIAIQVRIVCQFLGGGTGGSDGGIGGMQHHVMQQQQQQQESPESLAGDSGKNGDHSGGRYM